jgi:hypothetical protein
VTKPCLKTGAVGQGYQRYQQVQTTMLLQQPANDVSPAPKVWRCNDFVSAPVSRTLREDWAPSTANGIDVPMGVARAR